MTSPRFVFLELLTASGIEALRPVMRAMTLGGVLGSCLTWFFQKKGSSGRALLLVSALLCGLAALAAGSLLNGPFTAAAIAISIGLGLGGLTVSLAASLGRLSARPLLAASLGTGLAYALCNVPAIFLATPAPQTWLAAGFIAVLVLIPTEKFSESEKMEKAPSDFPFWHGLLCLSVFEDLSGLGFFQKKERCGGGTRGLSGRGLSQLPLALRASGDAR